MRAHVNATVVQKPLTQETTKDLRQLLKTVEEYHLALENMGQPVYQQDDDHQRSTNQYEVDRASEPLPYKHRPIALSIKIERRNPEKLSVFGHFTQNKHICF